MLVLFKLIVGELKKLLYLTQNLYITLVTV
jgi:hypothetical protein